MTAVARDPWRGTPPGHATAATVATCTRLRHGGDWRAACAAAGFHVDVDFDAARAAYGPDVVRRLTADLGELVPDLLWQYLPDLFHTRLSLDPRVVVLSPVARASGSPPKPPALVVTLASEPDTVRRPRLTLAHQDRLPRHSIRTLPAACWRAGAVAERRDAYTVPEPYAAGEVDALRVGAMSPDDLHPLVHDALYPDRVRAPVAPSWTWPPVRVRCGAVWHEVRIVDGRLDTPAHDDREIDREFTFGGLGGPMGGCASAVRAWRTGEGRLPKRLRWQRVDFFRHALYGHTDDVLAMLDAGFDVAARDGAGATLMHYLGRVDHRRLWPRLRAAGLPVDTRDHQGGTPLRHAVALQSEEVVTLLLDAGADPHAIDADRTSPIDRQEQYVEDYRRHRQLLPAQVPPSSILARLRATAAR
ncbi:ankyrin repeat domain-containing protein [Rugosimonospora africana]|uniref:Ankyrin repeat-containing protein n=1 Tax=Rugosimonospora africana TaxID=556532 RepID=A0A8J3VV28_9ACTN|nr:ankyrin repeat domain-containing protein [Rugosimonospora africana]GIH19494.1 hypothetical protein Raf01_76660 [Rugosimonospora africana]